MAKSTIAKTLEASLERENQILIDEMKKVVLDATPVVTEPVDPVVPVKKTKQVLAIEALLKTKGVQNPGDFAKFAKCLLGVEIEFADIESDAKFFGPVIKYADSEFKAKQFACVVPLMNDNSHNYVLGKPYLFDSYDALIKKTGSIGDHVTTKPQGLRYATRAEINDFFQSVIDGGYTRTLAGRF